MRICRLTRLSLLAWLAAVVTVACLAQSAAPAGIPGPVTPPTLLSGDDQIPAQCKGVSVAEVKLEFVVSTTGDPTEVRVVTSPSDKHSACATEMIRAYKYLPATRDGKPVAVKLILTLTVKDKA